MTGLYYFGARYYDPRTSVWQSPDPIIGDYLGADPQKLTNGGMYNPFNLGLYTYTYNAPVKLVDPDGNVVNILFGGLLGAASDLAIQGVMIATGAQDSISWSEVGVSAALGASGVGLASVAQKGYKTYKTARQANRIRANIAKSKVAREASGFKKWSSVASKKTIHKNSLDYVGETHVYRVKSPDGTTYKIGESARGIRVRDDASKRAEQQVRKLNREVGPAHSSEIRETFPNKASAREYETKLIERYRRMYGQDTLPGNKTNR